MSNEELNNALMKLMPRIWVIRSQFIGKDEQSREMAEYVDRTGEMVLEMINKAKEE